MLPYPIWFGHFSTRLGSCLARRTFAQKHKWTHTDSLRMELMWLYWISVQQRGWITWSVVASLTIQRMIIASLFLLPSWICLIFCPHPWSKVCVLALWFPWLNCLFCVCRDSSGQLTWAVFEVEVEGFILWCWDTGSGLGLSFHHARRTFAE